MTTDDENATDTLASLESALIAEIAAAADLAASSACASPRSARRGDLRADGDARRAARRSAQGLRPGRQRPQDPRQRGARKPQGRAGARRAHGPLATEKADVTLPVRLAARRTGASTRSARSSTRSSRSSATWASPSPKAPTSRPTIYNFTKLNIPPEHPARQEHDTFYMQAPARPTATRDQAAAHAHEPGADPHDAEPEAADPHHRARPRLSPRQRRHAHADVPPDRGAGDRRDDAPRPPQVVPRGVLQGILRGRRGAHALPRLALPVHRAVHGGRHRRRRHRQAGQLAGDPGQRHGAPQRHPQLRPRPRRSIRASPSAWASTASPC